MRGTKGASMPLFIDLLMVFTICAIMAITFLLLVSAYKDREIDEEHIRSGIYVAKLYFSPEIFVYEKNNILQLGVVDADKFTQPWLDEHNTYKNPRIGVKIELLDTEGNSVGDKTLYNNKAYYELHEPMSGVRGNSGTDKQIVTYPITYKNQNGDLLAHYMRVTMVMNHAR